MHNVPFLAVIGAFAVAHAVFEVVVFTGGFNDAASTPYLILLSRQSICMNSCRPGMVLPASVQMHK